MGKHAIRNFAFGAIAIGLVFVVIFVTQPMAMGLGEAITPEGEIEFIDKTAAVTLTLNEYTGTHGKQGARTAVDGTLTVTRGTDKIVNDETANTTTGVSQDDVINVHGTGSTYYINPELSYTVEGTTPMINLDAYTAVDTTDMVIVCYQKDGITPLTADDNANIYYSLTAI